MEEKIRALRERMEERIGQISSKENLAAFWQDFLGKKGSIAELMKGLGAVSKEDRPAMGKVINDFKVQVEAQYKALSEKMEQMELAARNRKEQVDITLPGTKRSLGGLHPLTIVKNEMIGVFAGMFFGAIGVVVGPWVGAVLGELLGGKAVAEAVRAGWGSFVGLLCGTVLKLVCCGLMAVALIQAIW